MESGEAVLVKQRSQFALRRKIALTDALIIAAHERRGGGPRQCEEILRRLQFTAQFAVRIDHDSPLWRGQHRSEPDQRKECADAEKREFCEKMNFQTLRCAKATASAGLERWPQPRGRSWSQLPRLARRTELNTIAVRAGMVAGITFRFVKGDHTGENRRPFAASRL